MKEGVAQEAHGDVDHSGRKRNHKRRKGAYKELNQRVQRCKALESVALKMRKQKDMMVSASNIAMVTDLHSVHRPKGSGGKYKATPPSQQCTSGNKNAKDNYSHH
jgi:hypothetical protein